MGTLEFKRIMRDVKEQEFDCGVESINNMIKESYYPFITQHAYTYSIYYEKYLIGYIQILLRDIMLYSLPEDIADTDPGVKNDTVTSVHINFLAIDQKWQGKKLGTTALKMMIQHIRALAKELPIRVITIDARQELEQWYESIGFKKMLEDFDGQEGYNVAMYIDCIINIEELEEYLQSVYE